MNLKELVLREETFVILSILCKSIKKGVHIFAPLANPEIFKTVRGAADAA
jgi:hypothetical protein